MALSFDLYWSFRSPYSYLATGRIVDFVRDYDVEVKLKPVYPLAVRADDFFKEVDPLWVPYVIRDTLRVAEMEGIAFGFPRPDPIVMDLSTGEVPRDQPYIRRLMHLGILAEEAGRGLAFADEVSRIIWSGEVDGWDQGDHLAQAAARAGLSLEAMEAQAAQEASRIEAVIEANHVAQREGGHWGVPLMVFDGEPFFGQDRLAHMIWRMEKAGLKRRS